jgi:hypothetical protein
VTPILSQWTYQAMIHELFGIHNNRVVVGNAHKKKDAETDEVVLSCEQDRFFEKNMYSNWGDLCMRLKQFVDGQVSLGCKNSRQSKPCLKGNLHLNSRRRATRRPTSRASRR